MSALSSACGDALATCRQSPIGLSVRTTQEPIITRALIGGHRRRPRPSRLTPAPTSAWSSRPPRAPTPGNCVDDPCNPPLHAPHRAPRLGPSRAEHFEPLAAMYGDAEVIRFSSPRRWIAGRLEAARHACRSWALAATATSCIEKTSGAFVAGAVRVPRGWPALEIGYSFQREFWGQWIRVGRRRERAGVTRTAVGRRPASSAGCIRTTSPQRVPNGQATVEREMVCAGFRCESFFGRNTDLSVVALEEFG